MKSKFCCPFERLSYCWVIAQYCILPDNLAHVFVLVVNYHRLRYFIAILFSFSWRCKSCLTNSVSLDCFHLFWNDCSIWRNFTSFNAFGGFILLTFAVPQPAVIFVSTVSEQLFACVPDIYVYMIFFDISSDTSFGTTTPMRANSFISVALPAETFSSFPK